MKTLQPGLFDLPAPVMPPLAIYDWIVVNTSAGKDSLAMLSVICEQARTSGVLDRVVAVHADLGRVEWAGTKELAERQAKAHGVKFIATKREQNDLLQHVEARGMWPSNRQRYCTSDHKRGPIQKVFTALSNRPCSVDKRVAQMAAGRSEESFGQCLILSGMGMRADESPNRAKKQPFKPCGYGSNGRRQIDEYLPLHQWSEADVWKRIESRGLRPLVHPAYGYGMPRLSCCFCIFAPKAALMVAGRHNPELLAEYVRVEKKIGHTFRMELSLAQVQAAVQAGEKVEGVSNWKM